MRNREALYRSGVTTRPASPEAFRTYGNYLRTWKLVFQQFGVAPDLPITFNPSEQQTLLSAQIDLMKLPPSTRGSMRTERREFLKRLDLFGDRSREEPLEWTSPRESLREKGSGQPPTTNIGPLYRCVAL